MKLPFLKNSKWPRIAPKQEEKLVNAPAGDHIDDYCADELFDAVEQKDVSAFRSALEALVLNCFDDEEDNDDQ